MNEPTIFEQPIHSKDPEVGEYAIYMPEYGANGRNPSRIGEEGEGEDDFRDYVFPEGKFGFLCSPNLFSSSLSPLFSLCSMLSRLHLTLLSLHFSHFHASLFPAH